MKRILVKTLAVAMLAGAAALPASTPALAGIDIAFGTHVPIGDDGQLFVNISSHYFDRDRSVVDVWSRRFPDPDDLAVFLWITESSHKSGDFVFSLRRQGLGWFEIGSRCGIPVDAWYVNVPTADPGPPYGKAYGYWRKHQQRPDYRVRLNDRQARDLVAVRMCHEYYRVSPEVAMDWRRGGEDVRSIMTHQYRTRHREGGNDDDQGERRDSEHHGHGGDDHHGHGHGRGHDKND